MSFEPNQQVIAALTLGSFSLAAALVNAGAQLKVMRAAKKKGATPEKRPWRRRTWTLVGGVALIAVALGLSGARGLADPDNLAGIAQATMGFAGRVAGPSSAATAPIDSLLVADVTLRSVAPDSAVLGLLGRYQLRPYAVAQNVEEGAGAAWWATSPTELPAQSIVRVRALAVREARRHACAYAALAAAANGDGAAPGADTLALRLIRARAEGAAEHVRSLAAGEPVVRSLKVIATASSLRALKADARVAGVRVGAADAAPGAAPDVAKVEPCGVHAEAAAALP